MRRIPFCLLFLLTTVALPAWAQPDTLLADRVLNYEWPIDLVHTPMDDDDRLFIVGHFGKVDILVDGELQEGSFLDLSETGLNILNFGTNSEQGINGMAFDPDYANNGYFYVCYNGTRPDGTGDEIEQRIVCFQVDPGNPDVADTSTWYELLEFDEGDDPEPGHNGGKLAFGPDGYLYVSCGDGGSTGNGQQGGNSGGDDHGEVGNGQDLQTFLGKLLRINAHGMEPYTIPEDNPFVGNPDALDEIWSYGWRNPWRFNFDRLTGDLFIADVGEVDWEEINKEPAGFEGGGNYGWRLLEGPMCYNPTVDCDPDNATISPIHAYPHDDGECATVGGVMYRGTEIPTLYGHYLYSDFCGFYDEKFWIITETADGWVRKPCWVEVPGGFIQWQENRFGFAEDRGGEVYFMTTLGLYRLISDPNATSEKLPLIAHPNPAKGEVILQSGVGITIDGIEMVDSSGRIAAYPEFTSFEGVVRFDVSDMRAGVYILNISCNLGSDFQQLRLVVTPDGQ